MSGADTQWPRFEIFQQARPDSPFENVGSVHAPDAEMALQNARDVFVRRPQTASLWVVPASAILTMTREELSSAKVQLQLGPAEPAPEKTYYIFTKTSQKRSMTFVTYRSEVEAASAWHALEQTMQNDGATDTYVWWVVPALAVTRSRPEDASSLFTPAHHKPFRLPSAYHTRTLMDEIQQARAEPDDTARD